jgi:phospholipid transport system substrate-binding protein
MKKRWFVVPLMLAACCFLLAPRAFASVTDDVKKVVDSVVKIVSDPELKKPANEAKRRAALKKTIGGIFDYREMAKRSLGVNWKKRTPAEQNEFVDLFSSLLENTYAGKIESYNNEKIIYDSEKIEGDYAEVKSRILTAKGDQYTMDYRLMKEGNRWLVYDVVIEGVSMVSNYRSQFSKIIVNQGYGQVVKRLQEKSGGIKTP